jgi:hypothetical protein
MKRGDFLIGIGAGLVSAVLFATVIRGSLAGMLLFYLTPLPVAIVSLGWNHKSGLVASLAGAIAVGAIFDPLSGAVFAIAFALPAWWLAFLALLARHAPQGAGDGDAVTHWYPLGSVALWAGGISVVLTLAGAMMLSTDYESYRAMIEKLVQGALDNGLRQDMSEIGLGGTQANAASLARLIASVLVPMSAGASTLLAIIIMVVAAKIVALSGRLPRPLPPLARDFALPRAALIALAGGLLLAVFGGWARFIAFAVLATIAVLVALQGLATAHVLLARVAARPLILGVGYALLIVAEPWMLGALALLGLADMAFSLRRRVPPPPPPARLA